MLSSSKYIGVNSAELKKNLLHADLLVYRCLNMDKRAEGRSIATRSGASATVQGRSPAVNVINITRRPDGGIVNVEMMRQEALNQEGDSHSAAVSRGTVPLNAYRLPAYVTDQQSNVIVKQSPRKTSPNVSAQLRDGSLDWSDQYQRLVTVQPPVQRVVPRGTMLNNQQRIGPSPNPQHLLHGHVNDAIYPQHAHAPDIRLPSPNNPAVPLMPIRMEHRNGGISHWPAPAGGNMPAPVTLARQVASDPNLGNVASQLISRLPGLQYDVIPPRSDGPSEAERKVAVLTQQLENEMRLTTSQGSSLRQQTTTDTLSQYRSPPPYYGPHITANTRMATPSKPVTNSVSSDLDVSGKKLGDATVHQAVSSLSNELADFEQVQSSVHPGLDASVTAECYGEAVNLVLPNYQSVSLLSIFLAYSLMFSSEQLFSRK